MNLFRNHLIADLFSRIHFGERLGTGIQRMKDICKAENTPYPEIEFTDTHFYIVFKQSREYLKMTKREIVRFPEKFPESSQKILEIVSQNPRVTIRELSQK